MAVTVNRYNHTLKLWVNGEVDKANLRSMLLNDTATFTGANTLRSQVDGGSSSTVTITIATPGVVSWTSHGLANGTAVQLTTTGALPTGLVAGTVYYVVNAGINDFQLGALVGGGAIATSGSQSGTHTALSIGANEVSGNGWAKGGEVLDSVAVTVVATDGAMIDCADETKTATGGTIGPAYKTLVYDATNGWPLWFYTHNVTGGESAGEGTEFKIIPNANGIQRLVTAV